MGDEDHGRIEGRELRFEPLEALDVEVVRGLVEEQEVGIDGERARERGPRQLPTGERRELSVEPGVFETEAASGAHCPLAPGPPARMLEPRLCVRVAPKRGLVVGAGLHAALERPELLLELEQVARSRDNVFAQREPELTRGSLVVERDPSALRERKLTALERGLARDRAQERGLPGSVRACER